MQPISAESAVDDNRHDEYYDSGCRGNDSDVVLGVDSDGCECDWDDRQGSTRLDTSSARHHNCNGARTFSKNSSHK